MHSQYKFSTTIHCDDLAVVHCLRSLGQFSQKIGNARVPWGGTKEVDWKSDGHKVTFIFPLPATVENLCRRRSGCSERSGQKYDRVMTILRCHKPDGNAVAVYTNCATI
jgi:hypothetical protein